MNAASQVRTHDQDQDHRVEVHFLADTNMCDHRTAHWDQVVGDEEALDHPPEQSSHLEGPTLRVVNVVKIPTEVKIVDHLLEVIVDRWDDHGDQVREVGDAHTSDQAEVDHECEDTVDPVEDLEVDQDIVGQVAGLDLEEDVGMWCCWDDGRFDLVEDRAVVVETLVVHVDREAAVQVVRVVVAAAVHLALLAQLLRPILHDAWVEDLQVPL